MPLISIRQHGFTAAPDRQSYQSKQTTHGLTATVRGACAGWSAQAMRNNERFLQSVNLDAIKASPILAVTLTLRDAPETPKEFKRLLDVFLKWLRRGGFDLYHWVVEWALRARQEGGSPVPHLHMLLFNTAGAVTCSDGYLWTDAIPFRWVQLTQHLGTRLGGQHIAHVKDARGWSQYVAKHSARHNSHAQRQQVLPKNWERPGRMWGHSRGFPLVTETVSINTDTFHVLRRMMLRYLIAKERTRRNRMISKRRFDQCTRRIKFLQGYLSRPREVSEKLTVIDWVDMSVTIQLLEYAVKVTEPYPEEPGARV